MLTFFVAFQTVLLSIDQSLVRSINAFAQHSPYFDLFVTNVLFLSSVKMLPIVICIVWLWFSEYEQSRRRWLVALTVAGGGLALFLSRLIQVLGPSRPRPLYAMPDFHPPFGLQPGILHDWSSFPSDHAALAFAIAVGVWRASRPLGWICGLWATFVVCLPRIYTGYHYPSDAVAGAALGVLAALFVGAADARLNLESHVPKVAAAGSIFYSAMFIVLFELVTMFSDVRHVFFGAYALITQDTAALLH